MLHPLVEHTPHVKIIENIVSCTIQTIQTTTEESGDNWGDVGKENVQSVRKV